MVEKVKLDSLESVLIELQKLQIKHCKGCSIDIKSVMSDNFSAVYIFVHLDDYKLQIVFHKYQDIKTWEKGTLCARKDRSDGKDIIFKEIK